MSLQELIKAVDELSLQDRKQLLLAIVDTFIAETQEKTHDIEEFEGFAAHLRDQDAQEYVNELRSE